MPAGGEAEERGPPGEVHQEKVDAVQLEFTYLLTSQLDTQRQYFEERLARVEEAASTEAEMLRERNNQLQRQVSHIVSSQPVVES